MKNISTSQPKKTLSITFICLAIILIGINMRSPIIMLGSLAPTIKEQLHIGQTQIGWLGAIPMVMFAIGAVFSPRLSRRFGLPNLLLIMIITLGIGILLRVVILDWWVFFIGTTLLSLAIGFLNTIVMPAIKQLAPNNIALVTGVYSFTLTIFAGLSAGVIIPMSDLMGWRIASASWAIFTFIAFILWLILRPYLQSDNDSNQSQDNPSIDNKPLNTSMWKLPMAWNLAIFFGIQSLMYYFIASFLPLVWIDKGISLQQAGQLAMLCQLMAPIAIITLTWLMNRANNSNYNMVRAIAVGASIMITIGSAGMTFMDFNGYNHAEMLFWASLWTILLGIGTSMVFTLCLMLISLRTHTTEQAGDLSAMSQTIAYTIAIIGPLGAGWLYEHSGGWYLPLIIVTILMAINVIFAWLASKAVMIDGEKISC